MIAQLLVPSSSLIGLYPAAHAILKCSICTLLPYLAAGLFMEDWRIWSFIRDAHDSHTSQKKTTHLKASHGKDMLGTDGRQKPQKLMHR